MSKTPGRTIAIDPSTKGFSYILFEDGHEILDWGLVQVNPPKAEKVLPRVKKLFRRLKPDLLVLEEPEKSRRGMRARRAIKALTELADREEVAWCHVTRGQVRDAFGGAENKQVVAEEIAERFPELAHRLPRPRRPWMSEDERMALFDAASFALTVITAFEEG